MDGQVLKGAGITTGTAGPLFTLAASFLGGNITIVLRILTGGLVLVLLVPVVVFVFVLFLESIVFRLQPVNFPYQPLDEIQQFSHRCRQDGVFNGSDIYRDLLEFVLDLFPIHASIIGDRQFQAVLAFERIRRPG